jgi:hypothetical protein
MCSSRFIFAPVERVEFSDARRMEASALFIGHLPCKRMRAATGIKVDGRKSHAELRPHVVGAGEAARSSEAQGRRNGDRADDRGVRPRERDPAI